MSPILLRPSREQDEHDRLARHLEGKYAKRKFDVFVNVRDEQLMPVKIGPLTLYPDLVLGEGRKLAGVVEIETGESVNNLEVLAQWVHFGKAKVPFHLYVPANMYEASRRLAETYGARITEIWTYRGAVDGFDLVRMYADSAAKFPKPTVVLRPNAPRQPVVPAAPPAPPAPAPAPPPPNTGRAAAGKREKSTVKAASPSGEAEKRNGKAGPEEKTPVTLRKGRTSKPAAAAGSGPRARQKTLPRGAAGSAARKKAVRPVKATPPSRRPLPVKVKGKAAAGGRAKTPVARRPAAARKARKR